MKHSAKKTVVAISIRQILLVSIILIVLILVDIWLIMKSCSLIVGTLLLPLIIAWSFITLHSCRWKIIFTSEGIENNLMFGSQRYTYAQIKEVTQYRSYTEGEIVWIAFWSGKRIRFSSNDRNYTSGKKVLAAHHSIKRISEKQ